MVFCRYIIETESQSQPTSQPFLDGVERVAQTILATLPGSAPCQQLQVVLEQDVGAELVICLIEQHYAEGIGWYDQRSLRLEPRQWQKLQAVLGTKRAETTIEANLDSSEYCATIPFPGPSVAWPTRPAVGDGL